MLLSIKYAVFACYCALFSEKCRKTVVEKYVENGLFP
nr:MAG TPA: hypothetical protein [Caudoviricetes sp.]